MNDLLNRKTFSSHFDNHQYVKIFELLLDDESKQPLKVSGYFRNRNAQYTISVMFNLC